MDVKISILLLGLLGWTSAQECNTASYPSLASCTCEPSKENPVTIKCTELASLPSIPAETRTLYIYNSTLKRIIKAPGTWNPLLALFIQSSAVLDIENKALEGLTNLVELGLQDNTLTNILLDTFKGLTSLRDLSLGNNMITTIAVDAFDLPSLKMLDLSGNRLLTLENVFGSQDKIEDLNLSSNQLRIVPTVTSNFKSLTKLNLNMNKISALPDDSLKYLINLEELDLDGNMLTSVPENGLEGLAQLRVLGLSHNQITEVNERAFEVCRSTIRDVRLNNNKLTTLSDKLLQWRKLTSLTLHGNMWNCDCKIIWMTTFKKTPTAMDNSTCSTPAELQGMDLFTLVPKEIGCETPTGEPEPEPPAPKTQGLSKLHLILAIAIPAGAAVLIIIIIIVCCIRKKKNAERAGKSVKYSAVYKPTTEQKA